MSSQLQPIDTDPLDAIRRELVRAARRRVTVRRRRRHMLAITATAVGLLVVTSGALALTGAGTGVPAIDRFLDFASQPSSQSAPPLPSEGHGHLPPGVEAPPKPQLTAARGSVSPPLEVSLTDGSRALAVGYENADGDLCAALAKPDSARTPNPDGMVSCVDPSLLADSLASQAARTVGIGVSGSSMVVQGFAREDVTEMSLVSGERRLQASLSEPWPPGDAYPGRLRVFFASLPDGPDDPAAPPFDLELKATLADGSTVAIDP